VVARQEERVDSDYNFLDADDRTLISEILRRSSPELVAGIQRAGTISSADAEQVMKVLSDEFLNHLDDDWEPTAYGRVVSSLMDHFNAARLRQWP
jgi:hypothetical protein